MLIGLILCSSKHFASFSLRKSLIFYQTTRYEFHLWITYDICHFNANFFLFFHLNILSYFAFYSPFQLSLNCLIFGCKLFSFLFNLIFNFFRKQTLHILNFLYHYCHLCFSIHNAKQKIINMLMKGFRRYW